MPSGRHIQIAAPSMNTPRLRRSGFDVLATPKSDRGPVRPPPSHSGQSGGLTDQLVEDVLLFALAVGVVLGMPLGGDYPARGLELDRFDHSVGTVPDDSQTHTEL